MLAIDVKTEIPTDAELFPCLASEMLEKGCIMRWSLLSSTMWLALAIGGCDSIMKQVELDNIAERELNYVKEYCDPTSGALSGTKRGLSAAVEAKRVELQSLQADVTASKYVELTQKLEGYSAQIEMLNARYNQACRNHALCTYRDSVEGVCKDAISKYEERNREIDELLQKIEGFDVRAASG